jgi:hypothetical protein
MIFELTLVSQLSAPESPPLWARRDFCEILLKSGEERKIIFHELNFVLLQCAALLNYGAVSLRN